MIPPTRVKPILRRNKMKIRYTITGIDCPNCASKLESIMNNKEGIASAKINFLTERLTVESELSESDVYGIVTAAALAFSKDIVITK